MSINRKTGRHSQSSLPKVSFNLRNDAEKRLREIQGKLKRLTGGSNWTTTDAIIFAIDFAHKNLIEYEKAKTDRHNVEN